MAARVVTSLSPEALLAELIRIEQEMGRERTFRNAPRIIDLDILLYGDVVHDAAGVTIPHPRMRERAFVLMPLVELDALLRHPVSGELLQEILARGRFERAEVIDKL